MTLNSINEAIKLENEEEDLFPAKALNNLKMPQSQQQLEDDKRSSADFYSNHSSSVNEQKLPKIVYKDHAVRLQQLRGSAANDDEEDFWQDSSFSRQSGDANDAAGMMVATGLPNTAVLTRQ